MKRALILLTVAIISACGNSDKNNIKNTEAGTFTDISVKITQVAGTGRVEPETEIVSLAASSGGIVIDICKLAGSKVRRNDTIVILDNVIEKLKIEQLRSQYAIQQLQKEIDENSRKEVAVKLENRRKLLLSVENLVKTGAETRQSLDDLIAEVASLEASHEKAAAAVKLSEQKLREISSQIRIAEAEADRKILRSPAEGTLLDIHVKEGSAIKQFDNYAELAPSAKLTVRSEIDQLFADRISTGMPVEIRYIGSDSVIARGLVTFVSPYLKKKSLFSEKVTDQEDRLVREIRIHLEEGTEILYNSEVECIIKL